MKKGVPTARGGVWRGRTIKYILENPLYKGMTHYKGSKIKNRELVIIQKDLAPFFLFSHKYKY